MQAVGNCLSDLDVSRKWGGSPLKDVLSNGWSEEIRKKTGHYVIWTAELT